MIKHNIQLTVLINKKKKCGVVGHQVGTKFLRLMYNRHNLQKKSKFRALLVGVLVPNIVSF